MKRHLFPYLRGTQPFSAPEAVRSAAAALVAIAATGLIARQIVAGGPPGPSLLAQAPLIAAPIGASAVLLFALPASPLAQPRAVIGGNVVSALAGVACALLIPQPALAAAAAVGLAIALMALLRCLHPPGGAVALTAVIGGPAVHAAGFGFALQPIALCSVLAVAAAVLLHRLTGHAYPHHPQPQAATPLLPGYDPADLDAALARYGDVLDVTREDLDALFREVEDSARRRQIAQADAAARDAETFTRRWFRANLSKPRQPAP